MSDREGKSESQEMDEDEIPDSQVQEPQSSCETFMSQQSHVLVQRVDESLIISSKPENEELSEKPEDKILEVSDIKFAETSALISSLEANTSGENGENIESSTEKIPSSENLEKASPEENPSVNPHKGVGGETEGDIFEEIGNQDDSSLTKQQSRKRKDRSGDSTPSPKRLRKTGQAEDTPEQKSSAENTFEEYKKQDVSVMEISSTPEKTIFIDDSQEFSLRIEESSPPTTQSSRDKSEPSRRHFEVKNSWESHKGRDASPAVSVTSPTASTGTTSLSQKSAVSWSSHSHEHNLSWGSHKDIEDNKTVKEENGEHATQPGDSEKDSSPNSLAGKSADNVTVREVTETRTGQVAMVITWVVDNNNKLVSAKIKQLSLIEENSVDKPGRMSTVSTTSAKSSSSSGSVGLEGPFPLPGRTVRSRLSTVSTVSSTTSSSSASNQAWDGPFLKPQVPGSKLNVTFSCEKCGHHFPPVDRQSSSSPVVNGNSPVIGEEAEPEVKSLTPKRGRRPQGNNSGSTVSSGLLEEETSSSGSQPPPQASSTPAKLPRGRPKNGARKQNGTVHKTAKKDGSGTPARTPRTVGRASKISSTHSTRKAEEGQGEPVLARWGGDGRYYPGWVTDPLTAPQVLVRFCDGQSKPTALSKVVRADVITPGTLVLAATHSGEYEEALVVQVDSTGAEPLYKVERDKTQREVEFASIALQQFTVTELTMPEAQKVTAGANFNDLSLENIIATPRKRSARTPVEGGSGRKKKRQTTPQPCTSHGKTYNGPEESYGDTDSSTHSTCSLDLRGKEIRPLDMECFPPESGKTKLVYSRGNMAFKTKEVNPECLVNLGLGPIPEPGSQLFADCGFLITYTDKVKLQEGECTYSSVEESRGAHQVLWRDRLRIQIRNGGGKVYNSFSEVPKEELPNTYLITDKQCNTPLYLQCLVNNIPVYSHSVVIQCCAQNRPWKEVISSRGVKRMLAGYSLARRCLVNPRSLSPLRGRTLLLALSGESSLSTFWQSLVSKVGGSAVLYPHGSYVPVDEGRYDAVVTDAECDRELVAEACANRVPLVSVTWLQQVIITGEWRPPTEHPLYKYNTSGEGEGESPEY